MYTYLGFLTHLAWCACLLLGTIWEQEATGSDGASPRRRALLVGIDRYMGGGDVPPLEGAVRDVRLVRDTLQKEFGFLPEDILVLEDDDATHERIVRAFQDHLLSSAREDHAAGRRSSSVFWFSGHGSRVPDRRGPSESRELDAMDSSLIAFDSRGQGSGANLDLVDDELGALLCELARSSDHVLAVVDACHSGGGQRGSGQRHVVARYVREASVAPEPSRIREFWPRSVPLGDDEFDLRDLRGTPNLTFVGACQPRQQAFEVRISGSQDSTHGLLTYELIQGLIQADPIDSLRTILNQTAERVTKRRPDQTLAWAGPLDLLPFGGPAQAPPPLCFPAQRLIRSEFRVMAGLLNGISKGAVVTFHRDPEGPALATGEVVTVSPTSARVKLLDSILEDEEGLVVRVRDSNLLPPLQIYCGDQASRERLKEEPGIEWVDTIDEAQALVEPGPGGQLVLLDASRRRCRPLGSPPHDQTLLVRAVEAERRWLHMAALERLNGSLEVAFELRPHLGSKYPSLPFEMLSEAGPLRARVDSEGTYALELVASHNSPSPLYLTFLLVSEDGTIQQVGDSVQRGSGRSVREAIKWQKSPHWGAKVGPLEQFYALATKYPLSVRGSLPAARGVGEAGGAGPLGIDRVDLQITWQTPSE